MGKIFEHKLCQRQYTDDKILSIVSHYRNEKTQ